MKLELQGVNVLAKALHTKSQADFEKVRNKSLIQMRDRAISSSNPTSGGTPVDTSELRLSAGVDTGRGLMGYTKEYAPHVEYGHRQQVGRYVHAIRRRLVKPYVPGQYFLKANFNIQKPIYKSDLIRELKR